MEFNCYDSTDIIIKANLKGAKIVPLETINKLQKNNIKISIYTAEDLKKLAKKKIWASVLALSDFYVPFCQ